MACIDWQTPKVNLTPTSVLVHRVSAKLFLRVCSRKRSQSLEVKCRMKLIASDCMGPSILKLNVFSRTSYKGRAEFLNSSTNSYNYRITLFNLGACVQSGLQVMAIVLYYSTNLIRYVMHGAHGETLFLRDVVCGWGWESRLWALVRRYGKMNQQPSNWRSIIYLWPDILGSYISRRYKCLIICFVVWPLDVR